MTTVNFRIYMIRIVSHDHAILAALVEYEDTYFYFIHFSIYCFEQQG